MRRGQPPCSKHVGRHTCAAVAGEVDWVGDHAVPEEGVVDGLVDADGDVDRPVGNRPVPDLDVDRVDQ